MSHAHALAHTCLPQYMNYKLVYRRYAGLYFAMGVDVTDNELAYLESIHLFVELLDEFFRNVCELDIVFNFNKVCPARSQKKCGFECHHVTFLHTFT
jgi:hypothetical protein